MLLNSAGAVAEDRIVLGPGEPWEIFFFVSEVVDGADKGHFNAADRSPAYVLRKLGLACARAMLAGRLPWRKHAGPRFIAIRQGGKVLGAMLLRPERLKDGSPVLLIEYMVVAAAARRAGIGRQLVEYAKRHAQNGRVECYCTEASRGMQRLLKRQGFVRTHRAKEIQVAADDRLSLPSRWLWQP